MVIERDQLDINIEEYYTRYGPMVLRRCRQMLKNEDTALDAMQEVYVKLITHKKKLRGDYPSTLLYRIATNVCLNMIRQQKRSEEISNDDLLVNIASYDEVENRVAARDLLDRIFSKEPMSTREIAVMHYVDKMTLEEVGQTVGLSVSGVRKRLRKLKEKANLGREMLNAGE